MASVGNGNRENRMESDGTVPDEKKALMVSAPLSERMKAAYGHFVETTTFGGVIHTYLSPHSIWKAIWVVIVLGLLAATIWNTTLVVQDYLSYPVSTKVTVSYEPSVPFPTVTVCNRNPIQCLKLAFAYIKYPEELNNMFFYSNCFSSVSLAPLVYRLFLKEDANATEILEWREETYGRMLKAIEDWQFNLFGHVDPALCSSAFEDAGGAPNISMKLTLKILLQECKAEAGMADFLFPDLHTPFNGSASSGSTDKPNTAAADIVLYQQQSETATTSQSGEGTLGTIASSSPAAPDSKTTTEESSFDFDPSYDYYEADFSFADAPAEIYDNEKFITEFTEIAKNRSRLHVLRELLDSYDDFIVNCTYFGQSCMNKTEFVLNYVPSYGSCFSFNSAFGDYNKTNNASGSRKAYLTGSIYGLSLEVLLDQNNYLPASAAAGAGARVTISPPGVRPNPSDEGYYVKPHTEADLSLRLLKVTRLSDPYASNCWDDWGSTSYKPLNYNPADNATAELKVYSYAECRQVCSSHLVAQHCRCVDAHNPHQFLHEGKEVTGSLKVCDMTNKTDADCRQGVLRKMESDNNYQCSCNLPCEDNQYIATASTSEWPSDMYMQTVMEKYQRVFSEIGNDDVTEAWSETGNKMVSRELARINVYLQTLNIQQIEEEAKYDFFQLLSDLGGALGLYLGFCGITLFEILELLILMILSFFGFNVSTTNVGSNQVNNENGQQRSPWDERSSAAGSARMFSSARDRNKSKQLGKFFVDGNRDESLNNKPVVWQDPPGVYVPKSATSRVALTPD